MASSVVVYSPCSFAGRVLLWVYCLCMESGPSRGGASQGPQVGPLEEPGHCECEEVKESHYRL